MASVRAFVSLVVAGLGAVVVAACAASAAQPSAGPPDPEAIGPLYLTLLGNYAGRTLRLEADGQVLVDQRLTYPPPGAEHRFDVDIGPARNVALTLQIEGCDEDWRGEAALEPFHSAYLLIQGCEVEALGPD